MSLKVFVVGDPHIKAKNIKEGAEFVEKLVSTAKSSEPDFIVVLGDTLDTHEIVRTQPHKLACKMIEDLSKIAQVYLIIGNHDLINQTQFLTDNHVFNPLKKWKNVFVVDYPKVRREKGFLFVFCPYVYPGRFEEALNKLIDEGETWEFADCIFAHQQFKGCKMGVITAEDGDEWDDDYPMVISGHIHDSQKLGNNIYYTGSAIQHSFGESSSKKVWSVIFSEDEEPQIEKISLGMRTKKIVHVNVSDIDSFDEGLTDKYHIKLSLSGTKEQFKIFKKSKLFGKLKEKGVCFSYTHVNSVEELGKYKKQMTFDEALKKVLKGKPEPVKMMYKEISKEI